MRLLVSVRDAREAAVAAAAGADVIDAKDPARGVLGAVSPAVLDGIVRAVARPQMVSAALGDLNADAPDVLVAARAVARAGAAVAKVGISGEDVCQSVPVCASIVETLSSEVHGDAGCALVL